MRDPSASAQVADRDRTLLLANSESHSIESFDTAGNWVGTFASTGPRAGASGYLTSRRLNWRASIRSPPRPSPAPYDSTRPSSR